MQMQIKTHCKLDKIKNYGLAGAEGGTGHLASHCGYDGRGHQVDYPKLALAEENTGRVRWKAR